MEIGARIINRVKAINRGEAAGFCLGFVLGMGGAWNIYPMGPASACAGRMLGRRWGPVLGAVAGAALFKRWTGLCHTALFMILCLIWEGCARPRRRDYTMLLVCGGLLTAPFFYIESVYDAMTGLAQLSASLVFVAAFYRAGRAISRGRLGKTITQRDMTGLFLTLGGICAGGSSLAIGGASLGGATAAFATAALCCCAGTYAVAAAAVTGTALVLCGGDMAVVGAMVIAALAACRLGKRLYVCCAFFLVMGICCYYCGCGTATIGEAGIGVLLCLLMPEGWLAAAGKSLLPEGEKASRRLKGMEGRVKDAAVVLDRVSALLEASPECEAELFAGKQLRCVSEAMTSIHAVPYQNLRFSMECGGASCPKEGSKEAGDSMTVRELGSGKLIILSDGMGSGPLARRESRAAVSLAGDLMSIGVKELDALDCVNRLLICKGEYDMYATLDAMTFDYASGAARFVKLGAPSTYILREGEVTELKAETLPIGIVEPIRPARKELTLRHGDAVIMATDGITDALGEGMVSIIASLGSGGDPREMAKALLMAAMEKGRQDDMSVMVGVVKSQA
ncbi:MAG: SpoIIE family protein phosphatase [Clostridia bacterium]|nr:SpoIIE family protein phosphatase [Clostridia bacterium]